MHFVRKITHKQVSCTQFWRVKKRKHVAPAFANKISNTGDMAHYFLEEIMCASVTLRGQDIQIGSTRFF